MTKISDIYGGLHRKLSLRLSGDTLKARVFRGGAWLGSASFVEQSFRFARNMLLARVLAPEAFGTMAIISSTTSVLQSLTDVGAREALIQNRRGTEEGHVGAAWWLAIGRSSALYALVFLFAPFIASFYASAELSSLLRVAAMGVLFEGAISSRAYVAIKEMKFSKWAFINNGGGIVGVVVTILLSFLIRDVWALVLGYVAENAARCALSFVVCPFKPRLGWDKHAIRDLLKFSRGLFGLSLLNLIFARTDIFVLGKLYDSTQLGFYAMAIYLAQTPTVFIINLLNQTLLPAFTNVQEDNQRLNRMLLRTSAVMALLGFPILIFLFFCSKSLLTLVYGVRYGAAHGALVLAAAVAFLNVANSQITMLFYAKGLPQLHRRSVAIMAILMLALAYPFIREFGLIGGQMACLISIVVGYLFQVERVGKITGLDVLLYGKGFLLPVGISLGVVAICVPARSMALLRQPLPNIVFGVVGCLLAYMVAGAILL